MSPQKPAANSAYHVVTDPVDTRQLSGRHGALKYGHHGGFIKFRPPMSAAMRAWWPIARLAHHVVVVLGRRSKKEVVGINAQPIVAPMADIHPGWYSAPICQPGHPVRSVSCAASLTYPSIPIADSPEPEPTTGIRFGNGSILNDLLIGDVH